VHVAVFVLSRVLTSVVFYSFATLVGTLTTALLQVAITRFYLFASGPPPQWCITLRWTEWIELMRSKTKQQKLMGKNSMGDKIIPRDSCDVGVIAKEELVGADRK
jgi:hypothetical protein